MAKQKLPTDEELKEYSKYCFMALSRMAGDEVSGDLVPFVMPSHITKTQVFGAHINGLESKSSVYVPIKVVFKKYLPGIMRTSEEADTTDDEFRREKAVLSLDLKLNGGGRTDTIRIYPELYSKEVPECDEPKIIIREYIPERNLEEIALAQQENGEIQWGAPQGTEAISDILPAMSLLHVKSKIIASALKERGLLQFGTPEEADPILISNDRKKRGLKYVSRLLWGKEREVDEKDTEQLQELFFELDRRAVSCKNLLSIVDGELDVFPHHAMQRRLIDAGGVKVGGFVRDLAVFSAPVFRPRWKTPESMIKDVVPAYLNVRGEFEAKLQCPEINVDERSLSLGILFASFFGNLRAAASIVHYNLDDIEHIEKETGAYLVNAFDYLDAYVKLADKNNSRLARELGSKLEGYGLRKSQYRFKRAGRYRLARREPQPKQETSIKSQ